MSYQLCFDVGGTFTDVVSLDGRTGDIAITKVLTTADEPSVGVKTGLQDLMNKEGIRTDTVTKAVRGATTLITNCLIERKGKKMALLTTKGFRDAIEIGREWRYDIYDLFLKMPEVLVPRCLRRGVSERIDKDGKILHDIDEQELRDILKEFKHEDIKALAICFLHSYKNPIHEQKAREIVKQTMPDVEVSISSEVAPEIREYTRFSTTVANAYVLPIAHEHFANLRRVLDEIGIKTDLYLMHSGGGVVTSETAERFPIRLVESGPAAGAMAGLFYGKLTGLHNLVTFDMGGTTAKIALISDGVAHVINEFEVARVARFKKGSGIPLKIQVINMVELGAGGGSIATVDELGLLKVGPRSSGAEPGPACYNRGGTFPTVTDADLVLGYLNPLYFLGGKMGLRQDLAEMAIKEEVGDQLGIPLLEAAASINMVVNETMASATRVHLAEEGKDYRQYALLAFGGAGPAHAIEVARRVGIRKVICPLSAGVLSAIGLMATPIAMDFVRSYVSGLEDINWTELMSMDKEMVKESVKMISPTGLSEEEIEFSRIADMRYRGQGYEINVAIPPALLNNKNIEGFRHAFYNRYQELYRRYMATDIPIELISWRLSARGKATVLKVRSHDKMPGGTEDALKGKRWAYFPSRRSSFEVPVYDHYRLPPGGQIKGPAIVEQRESTTVVGPGDRVTIDPFLNLFIELKE